MIVVDSLTAAAPTAATLAPLYREHLQRLVERYDVILRAHGLDAVVLHTGTPLKKSVFDDQFWPLTTVPHTKHWLPLDEPDSALLIVPGQKPVLFHMTAHGFWEKPRPLPHAFFFESLDVKETQDAVAPVKEALSTLGRVAFIGEDKARAQSWGVADDLVAPAALLRDLDALRTTKTAYERACLREANRIACRGHDVVLRAFAAGVHSELDLHLLYLGATEQDDPETPYKNIVALGEHAATLHHVSYGRTRTASQSLLLDAGAGFLGYDSDITRTAVKGDGAAKDTFAALIHGVDTLQRELVRRVAIGKNYQALHNESHELLAGVVRDVGLSTASVDELVSSGATRKLLPHGLGHSLGIQTHDVGCRNVAPAALNPFLRNTSDIVKDQVFTIEPGCYFIDSMLDALRALPVAATFDWPLVEALTPFGGVRIEDDLVVEDAGVDNLTRAFLA